MNRTNSFLFTPLLHEVATGALDPRTVAEPLREIFVHTGVKIVQGWVESIRAADRTIMVKSEHESTPLKYDYLVVATGAETNFYGIPGAKENALPLKSLADAELIRDRVIDAFEQAILADDPSKRRELLSFAIVGGGATGVEVAAELAEFVCGMVRRYYGGAHCRPDDPRHCRPEEPSISLIHAGKELLEQFSPVLRRAAMDNLEKKHVSIRLASTVASISKNGLILATGESFPASIIIWSAGVKANIPKFDDVSPTLIGGRIAVDSCFRMIGADRIFAMGDVAAYIEAVSAGSASKSLPQLAQVAQSESKTVASNILALVYGRPLRDFHFHSKGSMVSVGQWFAIGEIYSIKIAGRFAWWMWRTIYLFKFASWKKRVRIGFEWFLEMFFPRDITKI